MKYAKPEVAVLGEAGRVIDFLIGIKGFLVLLDIPLLRINPAYDLDE